ncbi:uncharacterized protein DFL_009383 [Arthrobotrys flagrans]|uniref:Uncharacterized protein n=1 Tax=Arthrobotrys flagrans TaxID=97331 RepID=A0A436ZRF8_ARTFL|nr:hypothetical protein DFL_009383 [Arthrobotrys flagrans]
MLHLGDGYMEIGISNISNLTSTSNTPSTSKQASSTSPTDSTATSSSGLVIGDIEPESQLQPETPKERLFDIHAFIPTKELPKDIYKSTNQSQSLPILWPPKEPSQCNYVPCSPELNEQYTTARPSLFKSQSTASIELLSDVLTLSSKRDQNTSPTGFLRSVSLKLTDPPISSASSTTEKETTRSTSAILESSRLSSSRKAALRSKPPISNTPHQRVSLIPSGLKLPPKCGNGGQPSPLPKPYETRLCNGCDRYITLTKIQYVCNDIGCSNRLCGRCYNIWLDAKWEGRGIVTPQKLRMAYTAAGIRERYLKRMLQNPNIPLTQKIKYIGEAAAVASGHSFINHTSQLHNIGHKTDPPRYKPLYLTPLKQIFGKEEVEITLLDSSITRI